MPKKKKQIEETDPVKLVWRMKVEGIDDFKDLALLREVMAELEDLPEFSRNRILKALIAFFDYDVAWLLRA